MPTGWGSSRAWIAASGLARPRAMCAARYVPSRITRARETRCRGTAFRSARTTSALPSRSRSALRRRSSLGITRSAPPRAASLRHWPPVAPWLPNPQSKPPCRRCCWPNWPAPPACLRACSTSSPALARGRGRRRGGAPALAPPPSPRRAPPRPRACARAAADNVTRVLLELGGKSPLVVLADCDVEQALDGVLGAIYENAGQICSAGSRLIIERKLHGSFMARLLERVGTLGLGHGLDQPDVGPVNSLLHLNRIHEHVATAAARGNAVLAGGSIAQPANAPGGWFYRPTVIEARSAQDPVVQEEIFGPVLVVQQADHLEQAIALANGPDYALVAGIYTRDIPQAYRFARRVDAGQVYINEYFAGGIEVPFGGNRKSGFGREKGLEGIKSYCKLKSVVARV